MREERISVNSLLVNYKVAGEGEPVLILHGWGGSSDSWIKVQALLAKKGYQIIVPDFPGFGLSVTPANPFSVQDYVDWLNAFIKEIEITYGESIRPFYLIGHSFGGRVAIKFANQNPDKIKKLVFCNSAGIKSDPDLSTKIVFTLARIGNAIFSPKILSRFKDSVRSFFYLFLRNKDYVKAKGTMQETMKKVISEDLISDLVNIQNPTLIVWGEEDKIVPVRYAYIFQAKLKNSELKVLSEIGHSPHLEDPELLAEIVHSFLKP